MISKATIKLIKSLELRKFRTEKQLFVAEGPKLVADLISVFKPHTIVALSSWIEQNKHIKAQNMIEVNEEELKKASILQHPQQVLAILNAPQNTEISPNEAEKICKEQLCLALDGVQAPGNIGTIVRIADWFGIKTVLCSNKTADIFAPKAVQATMGSLARVNVLRTNLEALSAQITSHIPVYATALQDAKSIYQQQLSTNGLVIMGNEGNGISPQVLKNANRRLFIPRFPQNNTGAESLNVAVAAAIICAEFRRDR